MKYTDVIIPNGSKRELHTNKTKQLLVLERRVAMKKVIKVKAGRNTCATSGSYK